MTAILSPDKLCLWLSGRDRAAPASGAPIGEKRPVALVLEFSRRRDREAAAARADRRRTGLAGAPRVTLTEVDLPGKSMTSPAAASRRPPVRRPLQAPRHGRPGPLQLELFGGGGRQPERTFPRPSAAGPHPGRTGAVAGFAELFRRLSRLTRGRLRSLSLTDNRRTILSVRAALPASKPARPAPAPPAPIHLRIHRSFALAPDPVLRAVAAFLASTKGSAAARRALIAIREHFQHHRPDPADLGHPRLPGTSPAAGAAVSGKARRQSLCPTGVVLDLREVAAELNQRHFEGRLKVRITWGKAAGENAHPANNCRRTRTASLQLGSYSYEDRLIRIHRVLDRPTVPRYVVESVVYHELLHADLPPVTRNGRRYFHTPEFRRRERQFRHFERADCWVRENLQLLLRARRDAAVNAARTAAATVGTAGTKAASKHRRRR